MKIINSKKKKTRNSIRFLVRETGDTTPLMNEEKITYRVGCGN